MTSASVAAAGIIGWVGLVVPHLARSLVGPDFATAAARSAMLLGARIFARDRHAGANQRHDRGAARHADRGHRHAVLHLAARRRRRKAGRDMQRRQRVSPSAIPTAIIGRHEHRARRRRSVACSAPTAAARRRCSKTVLGLLAAARRRESRSTVGRWRALAYESARG